MCLLTSGRIRLIVGNILCLGAILSLFLGRDGGPREGGIRLPPEKLNEDDTVTEEPGTPTLGEEEPRGIVNQLKKQVSKKLSGYFARRVLDAHDLESLPHDEGSPVPLSTAVRRTGNAGGRTFSRTSRVNGSAYGYGASGGFRSRLASAASFGLAGRRGSLASAIARRRGSNIPGGADPNSRRESETAGGELNFAQRLLMANEFAVTNIADLWVAAAINVDNEDVFMSDSELEDLVEEDGGRIDDPFADEDVEEEDDELPSTPTQADQFAGSSSLRVPSLSDPAGSRRPSDTNPAVQRARASSHRPSMGQAAVELLGSRRPSASGVPAIFSHTGVRTPPSMIEGIRRDSRATHTSTQRRPSATVSRGVADASPQVDSQSEGGEAEERQPSLVSQLPVMIIIQYGMLALHSTTHDQISLSYLVS